MDNRIMRIFNIIILFLSLSVIGYVVATYSFLSIDTTPDFEVSPTFENHRFAIYTHIFASTVALTIGPLLFWKRLRISYSYLHRWLGRLYLLGVFVGGLAGLNVSFYTYGGLAARAGFTCLSLIWIYTGFRAYLAIRSANIAAHHYWMTRNFSLTFAGVTLRLWLPAFMMLGITFEVAYPIVAWLCWLPNILVADILFNRNCSK
ncbi:MAG: DUF2306 domain-containing protein [Methylotenera sp.]|nr:DUF2306 domain-containing protein [Methylotenera sp.]